VEVARQFLEQRGRGLARIREPPEVPPAQTPCRCPSTRHSEPPGLVALHSGEHEVTRHFQIDRVEGVGPVEGDLGDAPAFSQLNGVVLDADTPSMCRVEWGQGNRYPQVEAVALTYAMAVWVRRRRGSGEFRRDGFVADLRA